MDLSAPLRRTRARALTLASFASGAWAPIAWSVQRAERDRMLEPERAPTAEVALVLGAPVVRGITPVLEDRLDTAAQLLRAGHVQRLLLSGAPGEVARMTIALAERDIPGERQLLDPRGSHTYESLANARASGHTRLLVVTQAFHLPRALYLARELGLDAWGVIADRRTYERARELQARELASSVLAFWMAR